MALTKFCCCCDLRKGCVIFSWLNLMLIALEVANMASLLQVSTYILFSLRTSDNAQFYTAQVVAITYTSNIIIAEQIIKGMTFVALIWGLTKKQYEWYQPWLFVTGIECVLWALLFLIFFIVGCIISVFLATLIPITIAAGLSWYFWLSVYEVYKRDKLATVTSEPYEELILNSNIA